MAIVVGPNGSGKSNVADAIVWAAGSLSPTELRAEKPDDVLFAGSGDRPPADFCEVELVFDNADGGAAVPFAELSVARRLHRGGEGQYLLNGAAVRRLDLVELLADVGLGGAMHSIVGQGRVEEILGASPERRRELVEEAAGLGRFKRRRHRAELKLARVAVELERARDLESEVRARLRPLALQASAAERAERIGREAAGITARIAELDLTDAAARRSEVEERRTAAVVARRLADERLDALLTERAGAEDELADAAGRREQATAALYRLRGARERLALRGEAAEGLAADLRARLDGVRNAAPSAEEVAAARAEAEAAEREREAVTARALTREEDESGSRRAELGSLLERRAALEDEQRRAERDRDEAIARVHRLERALDRLEARHEAAAALYEAARALQAASGGPDIRALERAAREAATAARTAAARREELDERVRLARERAAALDVALAEGEGLPTAARTLAGRGARLALADIEPPPGHERAVAAALGWRTAAVVAPDAPEAYALLEQARKEGLGTVVVLVDDRARQAVAAARVVPADELLASERLAVTPDGHGYDPERGELWFVGEAAEGLRLELEVRRRALVAELAELEARTRDAVAEVDRAESAVAQAEAGLAAAGPAPRHRLDSEVAGRLAEAAERLQRATMAAAAAGLLGRIEERARGAERRAQTTGAALREAAAREVEAARALADLDARGRAALLEPDVAAAAARADEANQRAHALESQLERASRLDATTLAAAARVCERVVATLAAAAAVAERLEPALRARADAGGERTRVLAEELRRLGGVEVELRGSAGEAAQRTAATDVELARIDAEIEDARRRLEGAGAPPAVGDDREALVVRLERLERRREELGRVNPLAREEYERERERLDELAAQRADVEASLAELERLRAELTETVERRFSETFSAVERHFREVATALFPGGEGRLRLVEADHGDTDGGTSRFPQTPSTGPLARTGRYAAGVEVELRPAGKRITRLSLLSGGEKSLGAISFLFALFLARPCAFYLLDEVEAALDDANIGRFVALLRRYAERAQFLVITHQKRTIEAADVLYGVTMAADGVSQVVSRRLPREEATAVSA